MKLNTLVPDIYSHLEKLSDMCEHKNEWFRCSPEIAKRFIDSAQGDANEEMFY